MDYEKFDEAARELSTDDLGSSSEEDLRISGAREGQVTAAIESQTSQIPSTAYLGAAIGSMAVSALLKTFGKSHAALFVGQWAAPFLLMGIYNKMVKQHGSDAESKPWDGRDRRRASTAY
jgi:hypothetical protein